MVKNTKKVSHNLEKYSQAVSGNELVFRVHKGPQQLNNAKAKQCKRAKMI